MTTAGSFLAGLALGLSLLAALGPQALMVLRQGLRGEHVALLCALCVGGDALLIAAGILTSAGLAQALPLADPLLRIGGAAFVAAYGLRSLQAALAPRPRALLVAGSPAGAGAAVVAAGCLAMTFLNPHVYLDMVLLGAVAQGHASPAAFGWGAFAASLLFFPALGFGARGLRPLFARAGAWRHLDALVGVLMLGVAASLAAPLLAP